MECTQPKRDVPVFEPGIRDGEKHERGSREGIQPAIRRAGRGDRKHLENIFMSLGKPSQPNGFHLGSQYHGFRGPHNDRLGKNRTYRPPAGQRCRENPYSVVVIVPRLFL